MAQPQHQQLSATLILAIPVLFSLAAQALDPTKSGALRQQQQSTPNILTTGSSVVGTPNTSPTLLDKAISTNVDGNNGNFRQALRFKMRLVNDAMKYGGVGPSAISAIAYGPSTESPSIVMADMDEALALTSAELGASNEVAVDNDDVMMRSAILSNGAGVRQSNDRPLEPGHRKFQSHAGVKHRDSTFDSRRLKAAVRTKHTFEFRPVKIDQLQEEPEPRIIEVEARSLPLEIHFKSASSRIKMVQEHQKGEIRQEERTQTEEEPQRLVHLVRKPIIQEVREIITPYRRIVQEIQPVMEEIHTVISHNGQQHHHDDEQRLEPGTGPATTVTSSGLEMEDNNNNVNRNMDRLRITPNAIQKPKPQTLQPQPPKQQQPTQQQQTEMIRNLENFVRSQQQQKPIVQQSISTNINRKLSQIPLVYDDDASEFDFGGRNQLDTNTIAPARVTQQIQRRHASLREFHHQAAASNHQIQSISKPQQPQNHYYNYQQWNQPNSNQNWNYQQQQQHQQWQNNWNNNQHHNYNHNFNNNIQNQNSVQNSHSQHNGAQNYHHQQSYQPQQNYYHQYYRN